MVERRLLFLIAQRNFRDEEFSVPKSFLERRGAKVTVASVTTQDAVGMFGLRVKPDVAVKDVNPAEYDMLVVIGGSGSPRLAEYPEVLNLIRAFNELGKPIGAICLGPYVLAKAGVLSGVKVTVFPSPFALNELRRVGATYTGSPVTVDGRFVTADGPRSADMFAEEIAKILSL